MAVAPGNEAADERLELVRAMVVEAGLEVLDLEGIGLRAEAISYARVFELLSEHGERVSRSSVQGRIWASHDEFRTEVLTAATNHNSPQDGGPAVHQAIVEILRTIDAVSPNLDHDHRVEAFCRVTGQALLLGYLGSDRFRRFQAIKAAARAGTESEATTALRAMVRKKADGNQAERVGTFRFMFQALGLRARSDFGLSNDQSIELFLRLVQVLVSGSHLDHHAGFTAMASKVATDLPTDEDWTWTYFGFGFLACTQMLFERDPDAGTEPLDYESIAVDEDSGPAPSADLASLITGKPRRSRSELRELVVAAGVQLLVRDGLGLQVESLTYKSVFAHIRKTKGIAVHRSTVHPSIWTSQEEFRAEVLAEATKFGTGESLNSLKQAMAAQTVTRNDDGSINVRQMILDNSLGTVIAQMRIAETSPTFRRWQSIKASMLSRTAEENADDLPTAINLRYEEMLTAFSEAYRSVIPLVGLEVNPALKMGEDQAYHLFAALCATFATGSDFNITSGAMAADQSVPLPRVDGSGESDDWPISAVGSLAALDLLFVPIETD